MVDERLVEESLVVVKPLGPLRDGFVRYPARLLTHLHLPPFPATRQRARSKAASVDPPLELFGPVGGLLGRALDFAWAPVAGAQDFLRLTLGFSYTPLLFVYAHALCLFP